MEGGGRQRRGSKGEEKDQGDDNEMGKYAQIEGRKVSEREKKRRRKRN